MDHPRWSQAKERRLGELFKRSTLKFNGYEDQIAGLYAGMNLRKASKPLIGAGVPCLLAARDAKRVHDPSDWARDSSRRVVI